jgi:TMEM199 family protein
MVLLTMTPAIVAAVNLYLDGRDYTWRSDEPSLADADVGKPISHGQLIDIANYLRENQETIQRKSKDGNDTPVHLAELLRGSTVYIPKPRPKPEPTSEYKALMARLRKEEEARSYERMLNPPAPFETFSQLFPHSTHSHLFSSNNSSSKEDDDEMTYHDIDRQLALIVNVLVTVVACSVAIWIAARHWDPPLRLALSMSGSLVLAVAEVVVYSGYIRRLKDAKLKEKNLVEKKTIAETWIIEPRKSKPPAVHNHTQDPTTDSLRLRKKQKG